MRLGLESLRVYVALGQSLLRGRVGGTAGSWSSLSWTDATPWLLNDELVIRRGRPDELSPFQPSTANLVFGSRMGQWDRTRLDLPAPWVVNGVNQLEPDTPVKVTTIPMILDDQGLVEHGVFQGVTPAFTPDFPIARIPRIRQRCTDISALLHRQKLSGVYLEEARTWDRLQDLLTLGGWPALSVSAPYHRRLYGDEGGSTQAAVKLRGQSIQDMINLTLLTEGVHRAFAAIDRDGNFAFGSRYLPFTAPFNVVRAEVGNSPGMLPYKEPEAGDEMSRLFTLVRVTFVDEDVQSESIKTSSTVLAGSTGIPLYNVERGESTPITTVTMPKGTRLNFGCGRVVRLTEQADPGDFGLLIEPIDVDIPEGSTATYTSNECIAGDNTRQLKHGQRELPMLNLLLRNRAEAQALANDLLQEYSTPRPWISVLPFDGVSNDAVARQLVSRAIGERVSFSHKTPDSLAAWQVDHILQGMEQRFRRQFMTAQWFMSRAPIPRNFWVWGTAAWGSSTYWGY